MSDTLFRVDNRAQAGIFLAFQLSQRKGIDLLDAFKDVADSEARA